MRLKKRKISNIVLLFLAVFLLVFVSVMIVTYWKCGGIPDTLVDKVLDASGWEVAALAAIKIFKVKNGEKPREGKNDDSSV